MGIMPTKAVKGTRWRPIKVREETYKKIVLIKGTLEQRNRRVVTLGETVEEIFLAACEELAKNAGVALPKEVLLQPR